MSPLKGKVAIKGYVPFLLKGLRICLVIAIVYLIVDAVRVAMFSQAIYQYAKSRITSILLEKIVSKDDENMTRKEEIRKRKLILLWTTFYGRKNWLSHVSDWPCPVSECDITSDRNLLSNSSLLIFHWRDMRLNDLPQCNASSEGTQHCPFWALYNMEAPPHTGYPISTADMKTVQDRFNWTISYRKDSDFFAPYGTIVPRKTHNNAKLNFTNDRRRLVCWLVSNCGGQSNRRAFVNELKKHIDIDIYGRCGTFQCPSKTAQDCYKWLSQKYKFYLALENSNCKDYTTEKLYIALSTDMVPIVMGELSNYDHLPPKSFIHGSQFNSTKDLAEYLVKVGNDSKLYESYFLWKRDYDVVVYPAKWYCDLCGKLHDSNSESVKSDRDIVSWWYDKTCFNPYQSRSP